MSANVSRGRRTRAPLVISERRPRLRIFKITGRFGYRYGVDDFYSHGRHTGIRVDSNFEGNLLCQLVAGNRSIPSEKLNARTRQEVSIDQIE
jgi:hypothetical protein